MIVTNLSPMPPLALLAGGLATRLRPLTATVPKSLLDIAGEPFIVHQLRQIHNQGISKIVICAGFLWEQIRDVIDDGSRFGVSVTFSIDGETPLGTGGALKKALPKLGDEFIVMYGDSYLPTSFAPIVDCFRQSQKLGLMTVHNNKGQWDGSNAVFKNGQILAYDKRNKTPEMEHIDYGLGLFRAKTLAPYPDNASFDLADVYQDLLSQGQLAGYEVKERFYEIGSHDGIRETDVLLTKK